MLKIRRSLLGALALADSVLVMKAGQVIEHGDTQALFDNPRETYTQELMRAAFMGEAA